jgi:hypothetical protein
MLPLYPDCVEGRVPFAAYCDIEEPTEGMFEQEGRQMVHGYDSGHLKLKVGP